MKCNSCGKETRDGAHFCGFCGAKLEEIASTDMPAMEAPVLPEFEPAAEVIVPEIVPIMEEAPLTEIPELEVSLEVEPEAEPVAEQIPELEVEPVVEPEVVAEPEPEVVAEPEPELVAEPEPEVAPAVEPVVAVVAEPEPAPQPVVQPAPQPVAQPAPQPVVQPAPQPVVQPAPQPVAQPAPQPVAQPAPQPVYQPQPQYQAPQPVYQPQPQYQPAQPVYQAPAQPQYQASRPAYQPQPQYQPKPVAQPMARPVQQRPAYQLTTRRGLIKLWLLTLITLGIYPLVMWSRMSVEINMVASRYDGKRTTHFIWLPILSVLTLGIYMFVWLHKLCNRIGDELKRRNIQYRFSAASFWLWTFVYGMVGVIVTLGVAALLYYLEMAVSIIYAAAAVLGLASCAGPAVFCYKLLKAFNLMNADYNEKG